MFQSAYLPDDLYKRVYDFCKRLLTLPQPYCTVGLSYTRRMKTERYTPGTETNIHPWSNLSNDVFFIMY